MATEQKPEPAQYKLAHEGSDRVLKFDYEAETRAPSIEDDEVTMTRVFDALLEAGDVTRVSFLQREEFSYDYSQIKLLTELTRVYKKLVEEENILDISGLTGPECERFYPGWLDFLRHNVLLGIKSDPVGSFVNIKRQIREELLKQRNPPLPEYPACGRAYLVLLQHAADMMETSKLIQIAEPNLDGYAPGNRDVYAKIFKPSIRPLFMYTKAVTDYPAGAVELEAYKISGDSQVLILKTAHDIRPVYHLSPPEFRLAEDKYALLTEAKAVLAEHKPQREEFLQIERTREIFFNISRDLIKDLARSKGLKLNYKETEELARILVRYTIGFGLIEILLTDANIQDISLNAPVGSSPISIIHADYGECRTNVVPAHREAESWATKLRLISGRPFDEANPVLDTELLVPGGRARVAAIQQPLSPSGIAFAFRRHREKPWTLPLFMQQKMLTPLAAGLISFLVDNARTVLIAGTRSAGKTSLLGALMVEIMRSSRILTVEDTLELPVAQLKKLNYDLQSMKARSVITGAEAELPAEQAIRTALRLGDSALIIGEVRSVEAKALYEAMRVGALAKVVAGTIHGDSPYSVFDRVVNDLGVPKTSFKATDIILVANPVTDPSGLRSFRRLVQVAEVRKHWTEDPLAEKGFADLMTYDAKNDLLAPTDVLLEGESEVLKSAGLRVKEFAGNWDGIWKNIELRAKVKQAILDISEKAGNPDLLEAPFVVKANDQFHIISDKVAQEVGTTEADRVFAIWNDWLKMEVKRHQNI
ncbi:MAG: type II/IV secretion system ATPase subunit [DPANN group archaeon]|nr:type II/IV secretion system ATPase subunit [DPANN group archaeon]